MKATEIRIGNIIHQGWSYHVVTHQTIELDGIYLTELFDGIYLTEEWVNNLGFYKTNKKIEQDQLVYSLEIGVQSFFQLNKVGKKVQSGYDGYDAYTNFNENINYISINGNTIKYVHQLQNLYFCLMGDELPYDIIMLKNKYLEEFLIPKRQAPLPINESEAK